MAIDFSFDNIPDDPSKIHEGNGDRVSPGRGMAIITAFNEYGGAKGQAHEVEFEIVAWTVSADVAKRHKENIFFTDSSGKGFPMKRLTCLAMAAGLFTANDVKKWKAAGTQPQMDMQKIVGRPIMIELVEEADKNDPTRKYIRVGNIGLAFYHIKDTKVAAWPKNQSVYNRSAAAVGDWITEAKPAPEKKADSVGTPDPFAGVV